MARWMGRLHLGELEIAVLEVVWASGPASVKQVHGRLDASRAVAHNSVQTTMERLFRKGILARTKVSHAYIYSTQVDRQRLLEVAVAEVVQRLAGGSSEPVLSAFVDFTAREGEDSLRRLEQIVADRLDCEVSAEDDGDPQ